MGEEYEKLELNIKDSNIDFLSQIELGSWIKQFHFSFIDFSKLTNPKEYPSILQEVKPHFIEDPLQKFTKGDMLQHSKRIIPVGSKSEIERVAADIKNSSTEITIDELKSFLNRITCLGP